MRFPLVTLINESINSNLSKRAVTYYDGNSWSDVSYAGIKDAVNEIRCLLKEKLSENETTYVLLHLNITVTYPSIVLGVLNAGLGFLCIDPDDSDTINEYIRENSFKYILSNIYFDKSHQTSFCLFSKFEGSLFIHGETVGLWMTCHDNKFDKISFIYALKTSGTTGKAKTVQVLHECIFPNLRDLSAILQVSNTDVFTLMTPITFDPSVIELFLPLMNGASLCIVEKYVKQNPDLLLDILFPASGGLVTILQTTPSLFRRWNTSILQKRIFTEQSVLKNLILGGEEFPSINELKSWDLTKNINIYNIYGITEVSCWASLKQVWPAKKIEVDIGTPLSETLFKLETDNKNEGELFIGSKTRKCLINDEACETVCNNDKILFRATGDIFKKVNGKLFFKRRKDDILKRWGTKFSTSSIEECVKLHDNVIACVCVTCKINHHIRIGLFIMEKNSSDLKDLKCFLKKSLPRASWPDSITALDSFPLTTHGKICVRSLNKMLLEEKKAKSKETFCEMWRHYSSENASGFNDFFSDGGDSLMALQLVAELKQNFNDIPDTMLGMILQKKTCDELWTYLADYRGNCSSKEQTMMITNFCNEITKSRTKNISKLLLKGKITFFGNFISDDVIIPTDIQLMERWKLNLGKCIDASPLVEKNFVLLDHTVEGLLFWTLIMEN
ncbi:unnamed protein product [Nezara viridula]|uniref:AMP-dependent synthetase/ligase domain-containing protein n=1 Tax=Nezara viridula TaxID=85310 RepID=A0A9P0HA39_NEZVI|nr:unnamed protein product [Nezara viridula]